MRTVAVPPLLLVLVLAGCGFTERQSMPGIFLAWDGSVRLADAATVKDDAQRHLLAALNRELRPDLLVRAAISDLPRLVPEAPPERAWGWEHAEITIQVLVGVPSAPGADDAATGAAPDLADYAEVARAVMAPRLLPAGTLAVTVERSLVEASIIADLQRRLFGPAAVADPPRPQP